MKMIKTDTYQGLDRRKDIRAEAARLGIFFRDDVDIKPTRRGWFYLPECERERRRNA